MNDEDFEAYFKKRLEEEQGNIGNLPMEILKDTFRQEYEFRKNRPVLTLKMEPQKLNHEIVEAYLPEKWEMPREGKLLYNDEDLSDVLRLIVYNLGAEKALNSIPNSLIKQYLQKGDNNE